MTGRFTVSYSLRDGPAVVKLDVPFHEVVGPSRINDCGICDDGGEPLLFAVGNPERTKGPANTKGYFLFDCLKFRPVIFYEIGITQGIIKIEAQARCGVNARTSICVGICRIRQTNA
jgi:hypothetical protein